MMNNCLSHPIQVNIQQEPVDAEELRWNVLSP